MLLVLDMWYENWIERRKNCPIKLKNAPFLKKFEDGLCYEKARHLDQYQPNHLIYNEGSPNFYKFKMCPNGDYIVTNPRLHLWKNTKTNPYIWETLDSSNDKYQVETIQFTFDQPYDLFLLQMVSTKDLRPTVDALYHATKNKRVTLFKKHPAVGDGTDFDIVWKKFESYGLITNYTILIENVDNDALVKNARVVYSADSAVTYNALIRGIPTATYRDTDLSEIVPVIKNADCISEIPKINHTETEQFLTWYHEKLVIDVTKHDYKQKRDRVVDMYSVGMSTAEIFG